MTPEQKLKKYILEKADPKHVSEEITEENVDRLYETIEDMYFDFISEIRAGEVETGLDSSQWSSHYESKEVATKMNDGSWIGWTYWYGGGKHGYPEDLEWMNDAYELNVTEEEKLVIVRNWERK